MKTASSILLKLFLCILAANIVFSGFGQCVTPLPGLVSWWRAEGTGADALGTNSGAIMNAVAFPPGMVGESFDLDGIGAHVLVPDSASLRFTSAMTIEGWIYPTAVGGATHNIFTKWDIVAHIDQRSYGTGINPDGTLGFGLCPDGTGGSTTIAIQSPTPIPANQWTHFVDTYDGSSVKMYINGQLQAQAAYNLGIFPGNDAVAIGATVGGGFPGQSSAEFAGRIDEIAVYNRALTASEIQAIYDAGSAGKCAPPAITMQPQDQTVQVGSDALFIVAATGQPPLSYQWSHNGSNVLGATTTRLFFSSAQFSDGGAYAVAVSNSFGSVTSSNAALTVHPLGTPGKKGQIVAWGDNSLGQTNVPPGLSNVIEVVSGEYHNLALLADGTVVAWGYNVSGETNVPAGLDHVVAIAAGGYHSVALKQDGTVVAWGDNLEGQTSVPVGLSNVVAISAGDITTVALRGDGTVVQWPTNTWLTPPPADLSNVVAIADGGNSDGDNQIALLSDGEIRLWGRWSSYPAPSSNITAIAAGGRSGFALMADGTVTEWGWAAPQPVALDHIVAIAPQVALRADGTVVTWPPDSVATDLSYVAAISRTLGLLGDGPPVQGAYLVQPRFGPGGFAVSLPSSSGRVYALEYKDSLADANWTALPLVAGTGGMLTLSDPGAPSSRRFYRVRKW